MKKYAVEYSEKAKKQLSKLDRPTGELIKSWIEKNLIGTDDPRRHGRSLTGPKNMYWRYRVGDYRIIADIRDDELVIVAVSIDHRKQVYRR